jgi:hypothetical protein
MALRKAAKANVEVAGQGSDNISDTSPRSVDSIPDWSFVSGILQSELVDFSDDSDDNEKDDLNTKYKIVVQSGMHRVAARPRYEYTYGTEFLKEFKEKECIQYDKTMLDLIKDWVSCTAKFRANDQGIYSIASLEPQYKYVAMMTCRLFGREETSHFFILWVPLMFRVVEGFYFNWAKILSDSLANQVTENREQK